MKLPMVMEELSTLEAIGLGVLCRNSCLSAPDNRSGYGRLYSLKVDPFHINCQQHLILFCKVFEMKRLCTSLDFQ